MAFAAGAVELMATRALTLASACVLACGGRTSASATVDFSPLPSSAPVQSVSVGEDFACELLAGGSLQCVGDDDADELGSPTGPCANSTTGANSCSAVALPVPGLDSVVEIAAGAGFACALAQNGDVQCWGSNAMGQLGMSVPLGGHDGPVVVASGATAIAVGYETSCAQLSNGAWKCWGADAMQTDAAGNALSMPGGWNPGVDGAVAIGFGSVGSSEFGCALFSDGSVQCFGALPWESGAISAPSVLAGVPSLQQIAVGWNYACGLTSAAQVVCWGNNIDGQLGVTPALGTLSPVIVPGVTGAKQVVVGTLGGSSEYSCALLESGGVECWGQGFTGLVGGAGLRPVSGGQACAQTYGSETPCSAPVAIAGVSDVTQLSAGDGVCALASDQTVGCWAFRY